MGEWVEYIAVDSETGPDPYSRVRARRIHRTYSFYESPGGLRTMQPGDYEVWFAPDLGWTGDITRWKVWIPRHEFEKVYRATGPLVTAA